MWGGRKGGASIHTWKSWWRGYSCFQIQSSKLAHTFKLQSLAHSFINRTDVKVLPAPSVPQTDNICRISQILHRFRILPTSSSLQTNEIKCAEFYIQVAQNYKFPFPPKAALFAWGSCTGNEVCARHCSKVWTWICSCFAPLWNQCEGEQQLLGGSLSLLLWLVSQRHPGRKQRAWGSHWYYYCRRNSKLDVVYFQFI